MFLSWSTVLGISHVLIILLWGPSWFHLASLFCRSIFLRPLPDSLFKPLDPITWSQGEQYLLFAWDSCPGETTYFCMWSISQKNRPSGSKLTSHFPFIHPARKYFFWKPRTMGMLPVPWSPSFSQYIFPRELPRCHFIPTRSVRSGCRKQASLVWWAPNHKQSESPELSSSSCWPHFPP